MDHHDRNSDNPLDAEAAAVAEAESVNVAAPDEADNDDTEAAEFARGVDADQAEPAEAAAIHTDTEAAKEASGDLAVAPEKPAKKAQADNKPAKAQAAAARASKAKTRSKRYQEAAGKVDTKRRHKVTDALELAAQTAYGKFDGSIDVHIRLLVKKGKADSGERFRMVVVLPHGTGKEQSVGVLDEAMIDKIKQKGDTEYDILLATPAMMPKVAQIAKILGPKGKMPNPKTGTVADDLEAAKRAILSGRIELRADAQNILHQSIGRSSWPAEKLVENFRALMAVVPAHRLQKVTVAATMGPGIEVDLTA